MADRPRKLSTSDEKEGLGEQVGRKAERKLRGRREKPETIWFGLGITGLVGWSVAIPALAGVALGQWMDQRWPGQVSWTLTFLFLGVILGCMNAWYWIQQESRHR